MSIGCPFCDAEPGRDCLTTKGGFAAVHVQRVKEAARINYHRKRNREAKPQWLSLTSIGYALLKLSHCWPSLSLKRPAATEYAQIERRDTGVAAHESNEPAAPNLYVDAWARLRHDFGRISCCRYCED
jgi:hypothetical protein